MYVKCPNCGEQVSAENINIQRMTAVCAACDSVFPFELPETKAKRRKVKQPAKLTLRDDDDTLQMEFWTNFRLDKNENVISIAIGGVAMAVVSLLLIGARGVPAIMPVMFIGLAVLAFYWLALTVYNKTHIEMHHDTIRVTRKPLLTPFNPGLEISLVGVMAIRFEETAVSKKEGYDTPRYRVWAETEDGTHRVIVNDVTEEYAVFIAQHLQEHLHIEDDYSRLEDHADDETFTEDAAQNKLSK